VFGEEEVADWNRAGAPPEARVGDVDLEVEEQIDGHDVTRSYLVRKVERDWKIVAQGEWGGPE